MDDVLTLFLREFGKLTEIPRPSGGENAVCSYLENELFKMGLRPERDEWNNLICDIPPTEGIQDARPIVLQAHMDMVCLGTEEYVPEEDPVHTVIRDGWLCSDGKSTLGADCGAGIAAMMALLRGKYPHGAMRYIFTVDEERGLAGAKKLDPHCTDGCSGLINLDGFHSDRVIISSAGGCRLTFRSQAFRFPPMLDRAVKIQVDGLTGGHSGDDIGRGRANAARILLWLLQSIEVPYELAEIRVRGTFNAIPTAGTAVLVTDQRDLEKLYLTAALFLDGIHEMYGRTDPDISIALCKTELPETVLPADVRDDLLALSGILPNGVDEMHPICPTCVGSSANFASLEAAGGKIELLAFLRSYSDAYLDQHSRFLREAAQGFGYTVEEMRYPAWPGEKENRIASRCIRIAEQQGRKMEITAIHVGLEASIFHSMRPEMPVVSLGGDILDPHTVRERLRLQSAAELTALLAELVIPPDAE